MRGPHPQSHVTHRPSGHVTDKKRYILTFTRPVDSTLSRVLTHHEGVPKKSRDTSILQLHDNLKSQVRTPKTVRLIFFRTKQFKWFFYFTYLYPHSPQVIPFITLCISFFCFSESLSCNETLFAQSWENNRDAIKTS